MNQCPGCKQVFGPLDAVCPQCNLELQRVQPEVDRSHEITTSVPVVSAASPTVPVASGAAGSPPGNGASAFNGASVGNGASAGASWQTGPAEPRPGATVFQYTARTADGQIVAGEIEAPHQQAAMGILRGQGLWVSSIRLKGAGAERETQDSVFQAVYSGVPTKAKAFFFRQFATLIHSGINVVEALTLLRDQTSNTVLKEVASDAIRVTRAGGKLSDVFRRRHRIFGQVVIEMVSAGEEGGHLDTFLAQLADYLEREYQVQSRIKGALTYPAILVLALIFVPNVPILVTVGAPAYFRETLKWLGLLLLVVIGGTILMRLVLASPAMAAIYDQVKLSVPVFGKVVKQFTLGKFGRTLGLLYDAGLPMGRSLELSANACGNRYLREQLLKAVPVVQSGGLLSEAIQRAGVFSSTVIAMIQTGERTGNMDQMVRKVAEFAEQDANVAIDQGIAFILPASVIIIGVIVGIKLMGMYVNLATTELHAGD